MQSHRNVTVEIFAVDEKNPMCYTDHVMMWKGVYLFIFPVCIANACRAGTYYYSGNVVIAENEVIDGDVYITDNTNLINNGVIRGTVHIDDAFALTITNHNVLESDFSVAGGASISQSVAGVNDLNLITNLSGHSVDVKNAYMLDMAALAAVAENASEIQMTDSVILINQEIANINKPIYVNGGVSFVINGSHLDGPCTLLDNINGTPFMTVSGIDPMFVGTPYIIGDQLKLRFDRQTNYSIVYGGAMGDYLDSLRAKNPNDKFIWQLDRATNRAALNRTLNNSARMRPILLSRPINVVNTLHDGRVFNDSDFMANVKPFYISSDEFSMWGGGVDVAGRLYDNLYAKVGVFGGRLHYDSKLDEYDSVLYGGNFDVGYVDKDLYIGGYGTLSYAKFDDLDVFSDGKVVHNPGAVAGRFGLDAGPIFKISDEIKIAPFVGGICDYAAVADDSDTDFNARAGVEASINTAQDGNRYATGVRSFIQTDGGIYATIYSSMLSIADGVGGGINFGLLYDDSVFSYKIMLDVNFLF